MRKCPLCKQGNPSEYCTVQNHTYLRCDECGLIYVDTVEPWDKLYRSYDGGFFKSLRRKLVNPFRRFRHVQGLDHSMQRARRILAFVKSIVGPGTIDFLDVGCNRGFLLAASIELGWKPYGLEVVPELLGPFRKSFPQLAERTMAGKLADARQTISPETFDAITAIDVIEHLEDPVEEVGIIHSFLKPGGIFVAQTPDSSQPQARQAGSGWGALKPLEHLHIFNPHNIARLSRIVGFQEVRISPPFEQADGNLTAVFRK